MSIVELKSVDKYYANGKFQVHALKNISFSVNKKDFIAVVGCSGSGKSTLLNLIGCLDIPTSGEVLIEDKNIVGLTKSKLAEIRLNKIGFIFQAYNLIPVLTAEENIEFPMMLQGIKPSERTKRINEILGELGLEGYTGRRPLEMSSGQQQRVAIARAIASEPILVLADEPTANLDSNTGKSLIELMLKLNKEKGVTFIFSTHDKMIMDYAQRIIQLKDGKIVDEK
ncbi:MAG: ABC transporter ATP-binding protein [bacterium]|nr:ABC transporter ATP-binding protein [bacterium]